MRAAAYIRLSKWDEGTTSPQRQREAIEKVCEVRGWALARTFEDIDVSGYNGKHRPGFEAMMDRLGDVDAIVFLRLDRLARSIRQLLSVAERCEAANVQLVAADGVIDTSTAMGRLFFQLRGSLAEFESATLSERLRSMHSYLREQGKWTGGKAPYGFRVDGDGRLIPEREELARLEHAARRYVGGESLNAIARDMGRHHPFLLRAFSSDRVIAELPVDVADALATARVGRAGRRRDPRSPLLSGIASCGECEGPMHVIARKKDRKDWGAYGCRAGGHANIAQGWLDSYVSTAVLEAIDTGKLVKAIDRRKGRRPAGQASRDIEARLELLTIDHYEKDLVPRDLFLRRREGLLKRLEVARKAEESKGIDLPRDLAVNLSARWETLSVSARRRIIVAVLERVVVARVTTRIGRRIDPERVTLTWRGQG